jgi:hypothetical protein
MGGITMKRAWASALATMGACGDNRDGYEPYGDKNTSVIGTTPGAPSRVSVIAASGPNGSCISICAPVDADGSWCSRSGGPVDVVVVGGKVGKTVCYSPATDNRTATISSTTLGNTDILQTSGATAIVFDSGLNPQPTIGDINVAGNEVSIYGNMTVTADRATLAGDEAQGSWKVTGANSVCDGNFAFADGNSEHVIEDGERGARALL